MSHVSPRYRTLVARLSELRRRFLPKQFSSMGVYSELQMDRARAYRILCHAEVESYIEARVKQVADDAVVKWRTGGHVCRALLGLALIAEEELPHRSPSTDHLTDRVVEACAQLHQRIKANNGIMEKHLVPLLLSVGYDCHTLSTLLLTELNTLGGKRGYAAHESSSKRLASKAVDPQDEFKAVKAVMEALKEVDKRLTRLLD